MKQADATDLGPDEASLIDLDVTHGDGSLDRVEIYRAPAVRWSTRWHFVPVAHAAAQGLRRRPDRAGSL